MTPEAQRIAIAEACGWNRATDTHGAWWYSPQGKRTPLENLSNYLSDLNAMHEAEKVLDRKIVNGSSAWLIYMDRLCVTAGEWTAGQRALVHATAAQRAEAFLKTLNLWDDSK